MITPIKRNMKKMKWIADCQTLTNNFQFNDQVLSLIFEYVNDLADSNTMISYSSFKLQLLLLSEFSSKDQIKIIEETRLHGWKNLKYKCQEYKDLNKSASKIGKSKIAEVSTNDIKF